MTKPSTKRTGLPKLMLNTKLQQDLPSRPTAVLSHLSSTKPKPTTEPIKVLPGLYLGNEHHASNKEQLLGLGIVSILNVAIELEAWPELSGETSHLSLGWSHNQCDIICSFEKAFSFIDKGRNSSQAVLVHCQEGVSRSASLVIAYLMRTLGLSATRAYSFLKDRSPAISPNINLFSQLVQYESSVLSTFTPIYSSLKRPLPGSMFCLTPLPTQKVQTPFSKRARSSSMTFV